MRLKSGAVKTILTYLTPTPVEYDASGWTHINVAFNSVQVPILLALKFMRVCACSC